MLFFTALGLSRLSPFPSFSTCMHTDLLSNDLIDWKVSFSFVRVLWEIKEKNEVHSLPLI